MKKLPALGAALFLLLALLTSAQAKTVTLPASLVTIENAAFQGASDMDGIVKIPYGVKTVGASAFRSTHVYGLDFASSITNIGDQNLASGYTAYAIVRGNSTVIASTGLNNVKYIFANSGSNAQSRASSDGIPFVPLSQLYTHGNFYYQLANGQATLLCAVDPELISSSVTIPQTVNGYSVTTLGPNAFFRCSQIRTLKIPHGVSTSSSTFSGCPSASVTYYGAPDITSVSASRSYVESNCGQSLTWTAAYTGGTGSVSFTWEVLWKDQVLDTYETSSNTLTVNYETTNASDIISVRVTATDERGASDTETGGSYTLYALGGPIPGRTYRCLIISNPFPSTSDLYRPSFTTSGRQYRSMLQTMTKTPYQITLKEERTASQMLSDISSAFSGADSNDVSMLVIITHGASDGTLAGNDNSGLSVNSLRSRLDTISGKKLVIIDACYSGKHIGKSIDGKPTQETASLSEAELRSINNKVISAFYNSSIDKANLATNGYEVITAASGSEYSWSYNDGSGTFMFIEMLRGCGWIMNSGSGYAVSSYPADSNDNRAFSHSEVYTYTRDQVYSNHRGGGTEYQHVQCYPSGSAYLFFAK